MAKEDALKKYQDAVAQAQADAASALYDDGLSEGQSSGVPGEGSGISQADLDAAQADTSAALAKLDEVSQELAASKSDDDADHAKIASQEAILEKVRAALQPDSQLP